MKEQPGNAISMIDRSQSGFTLIELLVVMVLLGLITSLATTSIGGNQARELEIETNRLHALLRSAANEAVFTNTEIGMQVFEEGYQFITYDEDAQTWSVASSSILQAQELPEWMYIEFEREGEEVQLPSKPKSEDREYEGSSAELKPDFMFLSSGEVTNFRLLLGNRDDGDAFREITLNDYGEIILPHVEARKESR